MTYTLTLGSERITWDTENSKFYLKLYDLSNAFLGGNTTVVARSFSEKNADLVLSREGQRGKFITLETFLGPFFDLISKGSQEFLRATTLINEMKARFR